MGASLSFLTTQTLLLCVLLSRNASKRLDGRTPYHSFINHTQRLLALGASPESRSAIETFINQLQTLAALRATQFSLNIRSHLLFRQGLCLSLRPFLTHPHLPLSDVYPLTRTIQVKYPITTPSPWIDSTNSAIYCHQPSYSVDFSRWLRTSSHPTLTLALSFSLCLSQALINPLFWRSLL